MSLIRYSCQRIDDDDIAEVVAVLKSPNLTQGPKIREFESALENFCEAPYAVAVSSGTAALHISCLAAGIGPGDEVITSPITFVASANAVLYCGAKPVFADIDPKTYNISPVEIEKKITAKTRAVIAVHFAGQSCEMEAIRNAVRAAEKKYGHKIYLIEDGSHALGSRYQNKKVGSCHFSDLTVMSFHAVKHITTGEGGAVFTADEILAKRLRRLRSHGITSDPGDLVFPQEGSWYYEQQELGYNYRITDIQCALGLSQLKKLPHFIRRRREIVNHYNESLQSLEPVQIPHQFPNCETNFHLYVLLFDFEKMGMSRARFMKELKEYHIQTQVHYIPVHTQPFYRKLLQTQWGDFPNAEFYYRRCLSIPLSPSLSDGDVNHVLQQIHARCR